ncbi:MAG TPA: 3-deoxy-manno-octulosonate cytidylyltransferase [Chlamydiales bacterium]|nr:3-deoxy-manno-octulosonate cytidylyltransferase [Chlamydiales bacterium]
MTTACVIPARLNSSRFPGKLLEKAAGKTVLQHTFEKALACDHVDVVFVATDNEQIADHVDAIGGIVIWTSPDCQNGTERIYDAYLKNKDLQRAKYIVGLQGDHPLTQPETISAILQVLRSDLQAKMSTAVTKIQSRSDFQSPHVVKCVFDKDHNALYFSRSPIPYHTNNQVLNAFGHIGIYCYESTFLRNFFTAASSPLQKLEDLEQLKVLENGFRVKIAIVKEKILGIDTPQDLKKLNEILCQSNIFLSQAESFPH